MTGQPEGAHRPRLLPLLQVQARQHRIQAVRRRLGLLWLRLHALQEGEQVRHLLRRLRATPTHARSATPHWPAAFSI